MSFLNFTKDGACQPRGKYMYVVEFTLLMQVSNYIEVVVAIRANLARGQF